MERKERRIMRDAMACADWTGAVAYLQRICKQIRECLAACDAGGLYCLKREVREVFGGVRTPPAAARDVGRGCRCRKRSRDKWVVASRSTSCGGGVRLKCWAKSGGRRRRSERAKAESFPVGDRLRRVATEREIARYVE